MALTLPSPADLYDFWGDEADDIDNDRATVLIQLSANLLWLATGLEDDPDDPRLLFLVKYAILDMAIFLFINRDNIDAQYSPFVSERIGSYSYSKTYSKVTSTVTSGDKTTGAAIFDQLVAYLILEAMGTWVDSEFVYPKGYIPLNWEAWLFGSQTIYTRNNWYSQLLRDY